MQSAMTGGEMGIWEKDYLDDMAEVLRRKSVLKSRDPILFFGSSSFRFWTSLAEDLQILDFLNAGIGGGTFETGLRHMDDVMGGLKPRQIVVYFGENDLSFHGLLPEDVMENMARFDAELAARCPDTPVLYISPKSGPARWIWRDETIALKALIEGYCANREGRSYVDIDSHLMGRSNKPLERLFIHDGIHVNREGYRIWAAQLAPLLIRN